MLLQRGVSSDNGSDSRPYDTQEDTSSQVHPNRSYAKSDIDQSNISIKYAETAGHNSYPANQLKLKKFNHIMNK